MAFAQYNFPTRIQFGAGAIRLLSSALREAGKTRPLIVTDRLLAPLAPVTGTDEMLRADGLSPRVFSGIWGNPVASQVAAGVSAFREHQADSVVGLGGGAAIDVANAVTGMLRYPGDC